MVLRTSTTDLRGWSVFEGGCRALANIAISSSQCNVLTFSWFVRIGQKRATCYCTHTVQIDTRGTKKFMRACVRALLLCSKLAQRTEKLHFKNRPTGSSCCDRLHFFFPPSSGGASGKLFTFAAVPACILACVCPPWDPHPMVPRVHVCVVRVCEGAGAGGSVGNAAAVLRRLHHPGCALPRAVHIHTRLDDEGVASATKVMYRVEEMIRAYKFMKTPPGYLPLSLRGRATWQDRTMLTLADCSSTFARS